MVPRSKIYKEIENYGSKVVELLNEKGEKAVLILSRKSTNALFRNYSDFFEEKSVNGEMGIELKFGFRVLEIAINDALIITSCIRDNYTFIVEKRRWK